MKNYLFCAFCTIVLFCSAPVKNVPVSQNTPLIPDTIHVKDSIKPDNNVLPAPFTVSVHDWVGLYFIVLTKQSPFNQYGYELYTCKDLDSCKGAIDTSFELPTHRIRCDKLFGHELQVIASDPSGTEYLITFKDKESGKLIYGKTHKQCIKEVVFTKDTEYARSRWLNRVVFSRKGVITTVQDGKNGFGSQKVAVQDSLKVIDIVIGTTPLPVNPIWLMVRTRDSRQGFIPTRVSWTNTMSDKIRSTDAWSDDFMEFDPSKHYSWDQVIWELINNHRITNEMNKEQVLLSWGEPLNRLQKQYNGAVAECWEYSGQNIYFAEDKIVGMENK